MGPYDFGTTLYTTGIAQTWAAAGIAPGWWGRSFTALAAMMGVPFSSPSDIDNTGQVHVQLGEDAKKAATQARAIPKEVDKGDWQEMGRPESDKATGSLADELVKAGALQEGVGYSLKQLAQLAFLGACIVAMLGPLLLSVAFVLRWRAIFQAAAVANPLAAGGAAALTAAANAAADGVLKTARNLLGAVIKKNGKALGVVVTLLLMLGPMLDQWSGFGGPFGDGLKDAGTPDTKQDTPDFKQIVLPGLEKVDDGTQGYGQGSGTQKSPGDSPSSGAGNGSEEA
ncbi:hypothetical protein [Nonomuraea sp. NPDC049400]|uniref:hypothetical protein n=1 Tax=Nonomuraea sp. NPDC049400 TaxID=3364352 RepID=UPI00378C5F8C